MKKIAILLSLLLISSCSIFGDRTPVVKPIKVITIEKPSPVYHPSLPESIDGVPVVWKVFTPTLMREYVDKVEIGEAPIVVYYAITVKDYENLSNHMADIERYITQLLTLVDYYKSTIDKRDLDGVTITNSIQPEIID